MKSAEPLCLAIDQGTHASRALVFDVRGQVLARGVTERTRGDMTISLRQEQLEQSLRRLQQGRD